MLENSILRNKSYECLQSRWSMPVVATLILAAIAAVASPGTLVLAILLVNPVNFGYIIAMLKFYRNESQDPVNEMFNAFNNYGKVLGLTFIVDVYIFLWSLLLIVPGIIKSYSYSMSYYILHDNPNMAIEQAIDESMRMMDGYKMKLFLLDLSFILWYLLGCITFGIGLLWVIPYHITARAAFYENLKEERLIGAREF